MCPLCKGQAWSVPHQMHAPPRGLRARYSSYQAVFPPNLSLYSRAPPPHPQILKMSEEFYPLRSISL